MPDTQAVLGIAGLISGLAGGLVGAYTTLRKDQRDQHLEPITERDAILTQNGDAMTRMDNRTKTADERAARLDIENDRLRGLVADEHASRISISYALDECRSQVRAWIEFGTWLTDRWAEARQSSDPPDTPGGTETGADRYPQPGGH